MKGRKLTPDEALAWAKVAATVRPIGPRTPSLDAMSAALETGDVNFRGAVPETLPAPDSRATVRVPAPLAERSGERKVRRGKVAIAATFDLHGHTQASAARALPAFLERQQAEDARCVLVITGKGQDGQGVLRRNFLLWLESPAARRLISGYAESHPKHGGAGAFYVFPRKAGQARCASRTSTT